MRNHAKTFFAGARKPVIMNKCGKKGGLGLHRKGGPLFQGVGKGGKVECTLYMVVKEVGGVH